MVDKRPIGAIHGKADFLDKKMPSNPKFSHVTSSLNTGMSMKHVEILSDKTISKRKNELFMRIKPATLQTLLKEESKNESIYNLSSPTGNGDNYGYGDVPDNESVYSSYTSKTTHSDAITSASQQIVLADNSEFLLLDLREPEDYELWHIQEAISYPAPNLGRDKIIPELFKFKNKEGKLIIIYHLDERSGIPLATLMAQKGYENVYLLTGGVEAFLETCPHLVEGKKVPAPIIGPEKKSMTILKRSRHVSHPEEGDVSIPSKHIEDDNKSTISGISKASGLSSMSKSTKLSTKTQTKTLPNTTKTSGPGSTFSKAPK